jgi:hypothetical protein
MVDASVANAVLLYGNGAELGDFRIFANDLVKTELSSRFSNANIVITQTIFRTDLFQALLGQPDASIKELHVFSHSIGGGLYTGYHETTTSQARTSALQAADAASRKITYMEVLSAEIGAVLTDHLVVPPFNSDQAKMQAKFAEGATAKLWGCNAGVENWVYTDPLGSTLVSGEDGNADYYYWRALNTSHIPKPSVAQGLADFWGIPVFGAKSGSHIEVFHQKHWITTTQYKAEQKHWPGPTQILRLTPDRGAYVKYSPN